MKKIAQLVKEYDIERKLVQVGFKPPFKFKKTAQINPLEQTEQNVPDKDDVFNRLMSGTSLDDLNLTPDQKTRLETLLGGFKSIIEDSEIIFKSQIGKIIQGDLELGSGNFWKNGPSFSKKKPETIEEMDMSQSGLIAKNKTMNKTAQIIPDDGYADGGEAYSDEEMELIELDDLAYDIYTRFRAERSIDDAPIENWQKSRLENIRNEVQFDRSGDKNYLLSLIKQVLRGEKQ